MKIQVVPTDTGEAWLEDVDILKEGETIDTLPAEVVIERGLKFADSADVPRRYQGPLRKASTKSSTPAAPSRAAPRNMVG